ncbi:hypothetical protein J6590_038221 [Homalodisca vitripennis]|nr:hypothetical protein J6590_038221 [Homalodisca vitripennis]
MSHVQQAYTLAFSAYKSPDNTDKHGALPHIASADAICDGDDVWTSALYPGSVTLIHSLVMECASVHRTES